MARRKRAPDPARLLADVRRALERGWAPGLTVLTGTDLYHLDAAQGVLLRALAEDPSGFGITVYGEEKVDVATVVAAARSVGMFAARRVVLVTDAGALEGTPEALLDYAAAPPANSHLIVRAPVLDLRRKLHKALAEGGTRLEFVALDAGETGRLARQVRAMAAERGLRLEGEAAELLVELTGGELYRVSNELDKIAAWTGEGAPQVGAEIVREVAAGSGLMSGWEVADALLRRDRAAALTAARRIVDAGDEPIRVLGGLAWRARVMLQAKAMLAEGQRPEQVLRATRAWYYRQQLFDGLERYSLEELLGFPAALLEADRTLKSRSIHAGAVLERLVDDLTRPARVARGRPR